MTWTHSIRKWSRGRIAERNSDVEDELLFHFQSLVEDNLAQGLPADEAWRQAREQFGSLQRYSRECRRAAGRNGWILVTGLLLTVLASTAIAWQQQRIRILRQHSLAMKTRLDQAMASVHPVLAATDEAPVTRGEFTGQIVDQQQRPIAGAKVLVILKTWPNQRFRQEDFATTSDEQGMFRLPDFIPSAGQYAIHLAAVCDGFTLTSRYELIPAGQNRTDSPWTLQLEPAVPLTMIVRDGSGRPVAGADVVPASRQSADGDEHGVYFQASDPIRSHTDSEGRTKIHCFERGDAAEIYVRIPGDEWRLHSLRIPPDGDTVVVSS